MGVNCCIATRFLSLRRRSAVLLEWLFVSLYSVCTPKKPLLRHHKSSVAMTLSCKGNETQRVTMQISERQVRIRDMKCSCMHLWQAASTNRAKDNLSLAVLWLLNGENTEKSPHGHSQWAASILCTQLSCPHFKPLIKQAEGIVLSCMWEISKEEIFTLEFSLQTGQSLTFLHITRFPHLIMDSSAHSKCVCFGLSALMTAKLHT